MTVEMAQVVLMRQRPAGIEVLLLRRQSAGFSFPGGAVHSNEDLRVAAARVLFEDTGILLARGGTDTAATLETPSLPSLRKKILAGANATEVLRGAGFTWASEALLQWSQWISPSSSGLSSPGIRIDSSGTSIRLFIAEQPAGMQPIFAKDETVESRWILASDAELHADELLLSPHGIRTLWELRNFDKLKDVFASGRTRATEALPILPRMAPDFTLLLPWDPEYTTRGQGEALPFDYHPKWAHGPSRFCREDRTWKLVTPDRARDSTPKV